MIISAELTKRIYRGMWRCCDLYVRLQPPSKRHLSDARHVLERIIFPEVYTDPSVRSILFIGVGPYTSWYPTVFRTRPGLSFSTIDEDPRVARWGAREAHRIGRFESLADDGASRGAYDLVVANGLFGYGTDSDEANAAVIEAAHVVLRPGGRLLIGYGDEGRFDPDLIDCERFRPGRIPGLAADRHLTKNQNRHTFHCFSRV
jgi:SAM-dependent methyltransferase